MRRLAALVAVFAIISSNAWAFDPSPEVVGQIYFSIPFGAATKQEATPRLGFRVGFGEELTFTDRNARVPYSVLDWRSNLDGQTTLLLNGVDVVELSRALHAAEGGGEGLTGRQVELILLAIITGGLIFVVVRAEDSFDVD